MNSNYELADILKCYGADFLENNKTPKYKQKILKDIIKCRTEYFGGHKFQCDSCGHSVLRYNSCSNRHCPKCQYLEKEKWIRKRQADLLPIKYFHVVFTVPHELNSLFLNNQKLMYNLLFTTAWSVMNTFFADTKHLGVKGAMIAVLHTWGQNLSYHPHLHCIVPGGGVTEEGKWKDARSKGKYLFPVKALSSVFRARFVANLRKLSKSNKIKITKKLTDCLFQKDWVVYAKRPYKKADTVIEYLGRYTHKIAISNGRFVDISDGIISFIAKDYRKNGQKYVAKLSANEFIRRFCMHILPAKFRKVRHYGFLSGRNKMYYLSQIRKQLKVKAPKIQKLDKRSILKEKYGTDIDLCPCCKKGKMYIVETYSKQIKYNLLE